MNENPTPADGLSYRQSPTGDSPPTLAKPRARRATLVALFVFVVVAVAFGVYLMLTDVDVPSWTPIVVFAGAALALVAAIMMVSSSHPRSPYRFDSSGSRALNTLGRIHGKGD